MPSLLRTTLDGLGTLVFPRLCLACRRPIGPEQTEGTCLGCYADLTPTRQWEVRENAITDRLAGRLPVVSAAALFYYRSPSVAQRMIHALKYHHRPEIGRRLGATLGKQLATSPYFAGLEGVVPVPIHGRRLAERGYNQAQRIAEGIAEELDLPVHARALERLDFRGSQTKRGQLERLENVRASFRARVGLDLAGRYLLLVDDVMTTGATLDFCGNALLEAYPDLRLSVATLAMAER